MHALAGLAHVGDELDSDAEGERFLADGQTWATASHRSWVVHSLAASVCRAAYYAARRATTCARLTVPRS